MLVAYLQTNVKLRSCLVPRPLNITMRSNGMPPPMQCSGPEPCRGIDSRSYRISISQWRELRKPGLYPIGFEIGSDRSFDRKESEQRGPKNRLHIFHVCHRNTIVECQRNKSALKSSPKKNPIHNAPL